MSATAKSKSPGANRGRENLVFALRQIAAKSQRAADESAAVTRLLALVADKMESPPTADAPPHLARKAAS
jgi:hypothetical protein